MKVKTFYSWFNVDKKVNEFLADPTIEVVEIQYAAALFFSVMVVYNDKSAVGTT